MLGAVGPTVTGVTLTGNTASLAAVTTSGAQDYSGVTTTTLNGTLAVGSAGFGISAGAVNLGVGGGTITLIGSNAANDVTLGSGAGPSAGSSDHRRRRRHRRAGRRQHRAQRRHPGREHRQPAGGDDERRAELQQQYVTETRP